MKSAFWATTAAVLILAGCGSSAPKTAPPPAAKEEAGFVHPPRVTQALRTPDGGVSLIGAAGPQVSIRLASPAGRAFSALADEKGEWRIDTPVLDQPTLFGLSAQAKGRTVQAEGYLAVLPAPGRPLALLRAGGSPALIGRAAGPLTLDSVDIDTTGAAVVSGRAPAGAELSVSVDDAPAGQGRASDRGDYQIALSAPLAAGNRRLIVRGAEQVSVDLAVQSARTPAQGAYMTERLGSAWRIDWVTPGGGLQASIILDEGAAR